MINLNWKKRVVTLSVVLIFLIMSHASAQELIFRTGTAQGTNVVGSGNADFKVGGFTPGTAAYVALNGWSFDFGTGSGPRPIDDVGIWTQEAIQGGWKWTNGEFKVNSMGEVQGRFVGFINDENDDDPFTFIVNYLIIGQ